jgi:LPS export ABC transporter protein LptC
MRKNPLKYWPLLGIVILLGVICFYMIKARYNTVGESIVSYIVSDDGLRLENIHYIQNNPDEGVKWTLDAKEGRFSKDKRRISFKNFRLTMERESRSTLKLEGRGGDYDKATSEINLWGNLHGYTDDGYSIFTERIFIKQNQCHVKPEERVKIIGPFFTVTGQGLYFNLEGETLKILSDVTTLIDTNKESLVL